MTHKECPYRARAWWGDQLVADTTGAVVEEDDGRPTALYFPLADVRLDLFEGPEPGDQVGEECWSLEGSNEDTKGPRGAWDRPDDGPVDGGHVLRAFSPPPKERAWLAGMAAFDHDRVRVELVDAVEGEDARDASVKRFPDWGDAADLIRIMDVQPDGDGAYRGDFQPDNKRPVVEGSQMLGQAIVAAGRHAPGRRAVSAHMVFLRGADANRPLRFEVEELTGGRTFTALSVAVRQDGRLCASGVLLLDVTSADAVRHGGSAPDVPGPYESVPYDMGVLGRDLRVVDGAYTDDPEAEVGPPRLDAWVRFREVPSDPPLHAGLLAQFTGHMPIAAALRPHAGFGQRQAHRTLSTAVNAISISFHSDVRADQWMLYHHESTFAGDGMTHAECRVHAEDGRMLASFTVDAMVRSFAPRSGPIDDRTAL